MQALSDDDLSLAELSDDELVLAWDLWFDLAQTTNDDDPAYSHGVFQLADRRDGPGPGFERADGGSPAP